MTMRFHKSMALYERALRTIPLASQTFSKSAMNTVLGASPLFLERGDGAHVWDVDGNRYVDYVLGLLPVVLGYGDEDVNEAIGDQLARGISFSLATEREAEVAERLVRLVPCAEMVRFGKNGSDATSAAIRLARAITGRDHVAVCGYHGWHDWYIGATSRDLGVPEAVRALTHRFAYNDPRSLETLFDAVPGGLAAVILEPAGLEEPAPGFLEALRRLTEVHGALLIFDEIITGFRLHMGGAGAHYGVAPDLACFGKAMGNGMPISAIVGPRRHMQVMEDIFFSGTFGGEALSLAAAAATLDKLERLDAPRRFAGLGARIKRAMQAAIADCDLGAVLSVAGPDWWPRIALAAPAGLDDMMAASLLRQELAAQGLLMGSTFNLCLAHDDPAIFDETVAALQGAFAAFSDILSDPEPAKRLRGVPLRPVFRVRA